MIVETEVLRKRFCTPPPPAVRLPLRPSPRQTILEPGRGALCHLVVQFGNDQQQRIQGTEWQPTLLQRPGRVR